MSSRLGIFVRILRLARKAPTLPRDGFSFFKKEIMVRHSQPAVWTATIALCFMLANSTLERVAESAGTAGLKRIALTPIHGASIVGRHGDTVPTQLRTPGSAIARTYDEIIWWRVPLTPGGDGTPCRNAQRTESQPGHVLAAFTLAFQTDSSLISNQQSNKSSNPVIMWLCAAQVGDQWRRLRLL